MDISVVSCVNDFEKYNACVRSSFAGENKGGMVELIPIDNTLNRKSAPTALNEGLGKARGRVVVFCHQDVVFPEGWLARLDEQISIIESSCKEWGVLGTFGIANDGRPAGHIIGHGVRFFHPPLPIKVQSLDEHCLILRKDRGLAFDEDLGGFHLYGADICLQALSKGLTNYAIDARVEHLSPGGKLQSDFYESISRLYGKWRMRESPLAVIVTTCKVCRLRAGLRGRLAYEMTVFKKKRRRKRERKLRNARRAGGSLVQSSL